MGRIRVDVEIDALAADVWHVIEPIERHVDWMVDAVAIRFVGAQTRGIGTQFLCDTKVGPITLVDRMEVTEWEPERRMGVKHTGTVTGTGVFELEPIDLGRRTRLIWTEDLRFPWYLGSRLGEVVGGQAVMKQIWRRNLRQLKRLVEPHGDQTIQ
jgi:Polyketide cyclase / dehydrase and lipid transport